MERIETKYGTLEGISLIEHYNTGEIKECMLNAYNEVKTAYGTYVPQYSQEEVRKRFSKSLSFYKNGNIKSINLQETSEITTDYGVFPVELVSFYEDESIKRIFPLNGKITGYWTEEDEATLTTSFKFELPFVTMEKKIIGLSLYPSGKLKSLTLWPNDEVLIDSPVGPLNIRTGFSLYEDGQLKSCETKKPTKIETPIGTIFAFDVQVIGIHADDNSLAFNQDGSIKSLMTSTDGIEISSPNQETILIKPRLTPSQMDPEVMDTIPLVIEFNGDTVKFDNNPDLVYSLDSCTFTPHNLINRCMSKCASCLGCSTE